MALPLHVLFESGRLRDVELVSDNARMHLVSFTSTTRKRATRRIAKRRSLRLHGREGRALPVDRWHSSSSSTAPATPPTKSSWKETTAPLSLSGSSKLDEPSRHGSTLEYFHRLPHIDSSPIKPIRMTYGVSDLALKSSLSMPRRPLRKPFVDLSVVQSPRSKRYQGTTADMISMVLEELELPGEYSDDDDDDKDDELILADAWSTQLSFGSNNNFAGIANPSVVPSQDTATS
jgi:hypothetical protein